MEQLNCGAKMYCLGCLCIGKEYKIQEYKMRYYPHFKAILEVASLKLCYLCRKMAQHAELFMQNVQRNQVILENCFEDSLSPTSVKAESQGLPPIALSFSATLSDRITDKAGHSDNTCKGSFTNIVANTAGLVHTLLPTAYIKQELMQKRAPDCVINTDESTGVNHIEVKQELDISIHMEYESNENFGYDTSIKQENCPSAHSVQQENIKNMDKSREKEAQKIGKTKTRKKKITMKDVLAAAKKKNDDEGIEKLHITLEQCMEERRLKGLDPAYQARPYKCTDCVKGFAHKPSYDHHLQRHSAACGDFVCHVCAVRHLTKRKLELHERLHTVRYRCRQCDMSGCDRAALVNHVLSRHRVSTHSCPHCHKHFKRPSSYKRHVRSHQQTDRLICDLCDDSFAGKEVLRMHMVYQHPAAVGAPAGGPPRAHRCPLCPAAFKQRTTLRAHALTHTNEKPYHCIECDKWFKTEGGLTFHLKSAQPHVDTTTTDLPSCSYCHKRFMTIRSRDRHIATVHLQHRPHKCDTCDKGFTLKWELRRHAAAAHAGRAPPRHFRCNYCDRAFTRRHVLTAHIRRHTGERPFQCGECAATFTQNGALHTHRRLVHQKLPKKRKGIDKNKNQPARVQGCSLLLNK